MNKEFCILVAGQYTSGSTALYNIIRYLLELNLEENTLSYGLMAKRISKWRYIEGVGLPRSKKVNFRRLIKVHEILKPDQLDTLGVTTKEKENHVFLSYRSLRQLASGALVKLRVKESARPKRSHETFQSINQSVQGALYKIVKSDIDIYNNWHSFCNSTTSLNSFNIIPFEDIVYKQGSLIERIIKILNLKPIVEEEKNIILEKVKNLRRTEDPYHKSWVTKTQSDGMEHHGGTYKYDWETEKNNMSEEVLKLIDGVKNENAF